jgi:hypothetical protein
LYIRLEKQTKMKKYLFGFAAVVALGFSACTPDEPANDQPTVSPIVAKWEVSDYTIRVQDSMTGGMLIDTTIIENFAADELVFDFRANGDAITSETFEGETESDTTFYTYTAPILKLYEEKGNMTDFQEFTVTFSGNNVMLKGKPMYESLDLGLPIPVTVKFTTDINAKKK